MHPYGICHLVGGAITILKNDGVRQWEGRQPIYYGKKQMFETTNQIMITNYTCGFEYHGRERF
jgi:hypothetical protein